MSRNFATAYLEDTSLSSAWDMSAGSTVSVFSGWLRAESLVNGGGAFTNYIFRHYSPGASDGWGLSFGAPSGVQSCVLFTNGGNSGSIATGTSLNTWFHCLAIFDQANTTIRVYIDNVSKHADTSYSDTSGISGDATLLIGGSDTTPNNTWDGDFAEFGFFNTVPTDDQRAALAAGVSPLLVMPANLIGYIPFVTDDRELIEGMSFASGGTIVANTHPRVFMPVSPRVHAPATAAAGFSPAWAVNSNTVIQYA